MNATIYALRCCAIGEDTEEDGVPNAASPLGGSALARYPARAGRSLTRGRAEDCRYSVLHDFNALQKAYNAGSDAVHSRRRIHGTEEQLTAGQELCRDEILKMLQLGRTPEWRTLVLGKAP